MPAEYLYVTYTLTTTEVFFAYFLCMFILTTTCGINAGLQKSNIAKIFSISHINAIDDTSIYYKDINRFQNYFISKNTL